MLGFFDESGDPGLQVERGSSRFFVAALVTFAEDGEAVGCDRRIDALRGELRLPGWHEFHFARSSQRVREAFLRATLPFDFRYHLFILDKAAVIQKGRPWPSPEALYLETAGLLFERARPYLREVALLIDAGGNRELRGSLLRRLRRDAGSGEGRRVIKGVKQQDSHRNNLLQLADYVASCNNQVISGKGDSGELARRYLRRKEVTRGVWPGGWPAPSLRARWVAARQAPHVGDRSEPAQFRFLLWHWAEGFVKGVFVH